MAHPLDGMGGHLLRVVEARVEEQCLTALQAADDLTVAIVKLDTTPRFPDLGEPTELAVESSSKKRGNSGG